MTSKVNLSVSGAVPPPPTVGMTARGLMHEVGPDSALLEYAKSVERGRICLLHSECKSKAGGDKKCNLCVGHEAALPRLETHSITR